MKFSKLLINLAVLAIMISYDNSVQYSYELRNAAEQILASEFSIDSTYWDYINLKMFINNELVVEPLDQSHSLVRAKTKEEKLIAVLDPEDFKQYKQFINAKK